MVHVDTGISGLVFDLPRSQVLFGLVGMFLAMVVIGLALKQGGNKELAELMGIVGALGILGGTSVFPNALSTFLLIVAAVFGVLAIAHEIQQHGRNAALASAYVLVWSSVAYVGAFGIFWLAANTWLLHD